jgi:hypothetical protein
MLTDFAIGLMLDALDESQTNGIKFWSLHTAYSATGANELTGGSPAYARKAAAYAAASGSPRTKASSAGQTFDIPPSTTVAWVGRWDAVTVGNFLGMGPAGGGARRQFSVVDPADITANTIDSAAHGLSVGNQVVFWASSGAGLPTGLTVGTIYFVIATGLTTDVFEVSATLGGSAIDITAAGDGEFQTIVPEVYTGQGTYNMSSDTLSVTSV